MGRGEGSYIQGSAYNRIKKSVGKEAALYVVLIKVLFEYNCFFQLQKVIQIKCISIKALGELISGRAYNRMYFLFAFRKDYNWGGGGL